MFRHRRPLRRWAALVLLLWLFGIGAGVTHACLVPNSAIADEAVATRTSAAAFAHHEASDHGRAGDSTPGHHDDEAQGRPDDPALSNCLDFCEKARVSLPLLKSVLDDVQSQALLPSVASVVLPAPAFVPVRSPLLRRDGVRAPPIVIAFLRLTL